MDIEFHYYITYLICKRAGFTNSEAKIIAYSSQFVDDNSMIFEINKDTAEYYSNYISQTMNILKPKAKLFRIYPIFHFIPGDPLSPTTYRADGKLHWLNTTPNSENAQRIFNAALGTNNIYRIGIAIHSYADTWAHQNFIGYYDSFNSMSGILETGIPDIGHADAQHNPDWPGLVWKDKRLLGNLKRVSNKNRFIEAATTIMESLWYHNSKEPDELEENKNELIKDLGTAIAERDQTNDLQDERIERYIKLSETSNYGDETLKKYDEEEWFDETVNENVRGLRDKSDMYVSRWDPFTDVYTWKDPANYQSTNWYKFQEAVKSHQNDAEEILKQKTFIKLEMDVNTY
ncbi:MAG: hypothetical protein K9J16_17725 [Melioribacteraceae bacterium]|nr:hypothetical protein [Melioribacteraceae bacterium]MCF8353564.1 hypothetical protein [Melioribacteraceae bacterium]MCF8393487.1 hypothetical protein [Melioribacteraceae bacterium]MCF8419297.1 hypothetical protein [Melioribacteraceae bacterium]